MLISATYTGHVLKFVTIKKGFALGNGELRKYELVGGGGILLPFSHFISCIFGMQEILDILEVNTHDAKNIYPNQVYEYLK